jgi:transcriptional regulator with XRE-family HTH domain
MYSTLAAGIRSQEKSLPAFSAASLNPDAARVRSCLTKLQIAISLSRIAIRRRGVATMKLADKVRYLREVEGSLRCLGRGMTQQELVRAIDAETGTRISQSYLSQIESGARPHLTNTTRLLLARFFKVHPGYLVDDPEGYHAELLSDARTIEDKLDLWLIAGAERFRRDTNLRRALLTLARYEDTRSSILLLESILETPQLAERLLHLLRPDINGHRPLSRAIPAVIAKSATVTLSKPQQRRRSK